ncbi:integrator complex subunit 15 [Dermacentor albipictus]|uniref:integrator complex subunit 15 n=1 Tax=Dermacentor albipictus TaxID=60249 RepID=UPI0031FE13C1
MTDVRVSLRKIEFPTVVYEALRQIQMLLANEGRSPTYAHVAKEIAEEFVFQDYGQRRMTPQAHSSAAQQMRRPRTRKLPAIRELQIIEIIASSFQNAKSDMCQKVFFILFPSADPSVMDVRVPLLSRLVSLSIALKNHNVLNCVGFWMHVCGCTSEPSLHIVRHVVGDYLSLIPSSAEMLKELANISPLFCASLATSLTHMTPTNPSRDVVDLLASWVRAQPLLCFTPMEAIPPQLYTQCLQTFIPGLVAWCVLAPLGKTDARTAAEDAELYSYLHYALLEMLIRAGQVTPRAPIVFPFLPSHYVVQVVETLKRGLATASPQGAELALNRLGQVLQAAFASKCVHGNLDVMFQTLRQLPSNRLLKIVLARWDVKKY